MTLDKHLCFFLYIAEVIELSFFLCVLYCTDVNSHFLQSEAFIVKGLLYLPKIELFYIKSKQASPARFKEKRNALLSIKSN